MHARQLLEESLQRVLAQLPDERVRQVLEFAEFLSLKEEHRLLARPGAATGEVFGVEEED